MSARSSIVTRVGLTAATGGLLAAVLGSATAQGSPGLTHDLIMQKLAYTSTFHAASVIGAPMRVSSPVSGVINFAAGSKATTGVPALVAPGFRTFRGVPSGTKLRDFEIAQLVGTYTLADAARDSKAANGPDQGKAIKALLRLVKGVTLYGGLVAGRTQVTTGAITVNLLPGNYFLVSSADSRDGSPDILTPFRVASGAPVGARPAVAGAFEPFEYGFRVPAQVKAGKKLYKFHNRGVQAHIMVLVRVPAGTKADDVKKALSSDGPPPAGFQEITDVMGLATKGTTHYASLNLRVGTYALVCFMPEQVKSDHSIPHFVEGMIKVFQVTS